MSFIIVYLMPASEVHSAIDNIHTYCYDSYIQPFPIRKDKSSVSASFYSDCLVDEIGCHAESSTR